MGSTGGGPDFREFFNSPAVFLQRPPGGFSVVVVSAEDWGERSKFFHNYLKTKKNVLIGKKLTSLSMGFVIQAFESVVRISSTKLSTGCVNKGDALPRHG